MLILTLRGYASNGGVAAKEIEYLTERHSLSAHRGQSPKNVIYDFFQNKLVTFSNYEYQLKIKFQLILIAVLLSAFFGENLIAQSGTTSISGTVFDQQGKVISGASVKLSNTEKGFSRTADNQRKRDIFFSGDSARQFIVWKSK